MSVTANPPPGGPDSSQTRRLKRGKEVSSLTDRAYQALRREILTCALEPGSDISEAVIADRLEMSKTPVREALARLRTEGFVRSFPRRGYQIAPLTISDIDELLDLRRIVEEACGELAAERISDSELDRLAKLADATTDSDTIADLGTYISANREFHLAIANAANNRRLTDLAFKMFDELERYFYYGARERVISGDVQPDHHGIVAVLRQRDREAGRRVLASHAEATRHGLFEAISRSGRHTAKLVIG
jgi:DNA-binding GntR family transcriptional regulator